MYADFESILIPVKERYEDRMKELKNKRKDTDTKKVNRHVPSGWCVHSKFAYGDIQDPLKAYRGKDCLEKFVEYIAAETKRLCSTFQQQEMIPLTDVLRRDYENIEKYPICI